MMSSSLDQLHCNNLGQNFFISCQIYKTSYSNFSESRKKCLKYYLFYPLTLNTICFVENNNIFLKFCLCNFESDTVKSGCPIQIFFQKNDEIV